jgi:endonuclease/exonuclease/phosphatase family metal-dependent hydrolase
MTLAERTRVALTPATESEREAAFAGPADAAAHAAWVQRFACLHEIEVASSNAEARVPFDRGRVVGWNVERGRNVEALAERIAAERAELVLLSELDVGMARSGNLHTARELAERLGFGFVYAVEFVELGLGGADERAAHSGQRNAQGLHGGGILSATPLERPALVRLETEGRWFDGVRGERRVGGRMAVLATWHCGGTPVTVASVHLESHSDPADRCAQVEALLEAIEIYRPGAPTLIGGDLNTFSTGLAEIANRDQLSLALEVNANRLRHPVPHEPLFAMASGCGFGWESCNVHNEATHRVSASPRESSRGGLKLDWFLARGLACTGSRVVNAAGSDGGALSDHEAIVVDVTTGRAASAEFE